MKFDRLILITVNGFTVFLTNFMLGYRITLLCGLVMILTELDLNKIKD